MPEPQVHHFAFYLDAFRELSSCRNYGMGVGPIPFTAIVEYVRIYDVGDFSEFLYLIRAMDNEFIKGHNATSRTSKKRTDQGKSDRSS